MCDIILHLHSPNLCYRTVEAYFYGKGTSLIYKNVTLRLQNSSEASLVETVHGKKGLVA